MHIPQRHVLFSPVETFSLTVLMNRRCVLTFHLNLCTFCLMDKCNLELIPKKNTVCVLINSGLRIYSIVALVQTTQHVFVKYIKKLSTVYKHNIICPFICHFQRFLIMIPINLCHNDYAHLFYSVERWTDTAFFLCSSVIL